MEYESVAPIRIDEAVFRAPSKIRHSRTGKPLSQIDRQRAAQIRPPCLHTRDAMSLEDASEPADGGFDFRKLGHSQRYGGAATSPLEARAA